MINSYLYNIFFTIFVFISLLVKAQNETGFPFLRNYSPKEYNNTQQAFAIEQDSLGMMYFGMSDGGGIMQYDGKKWTVIDIPKKAAAFSFAMNAHEVLYVGAAKEFGYLQTNSQGKKEFVSLTPLIEKKDLKFGNVWKNDVVENDAGEKVYFMTPEAIFEYIPLPTPHINTYLPQKGNRLNGMFIHQGKVYSRETNKGLVSIEGDSLKLVTNFYKDRGFADVFSLWPDTLLIPTKRNGLYKYHVPAAVSTQFSIEETDFFNDNDIYSSALLPMQRVAIGGADKGMLIVSPQGKSLQHWNQQTLLQNNTIAFIYNTPQHNLWVGLVSGITRGESSLAWSYWDKNAGLEGMVKDIVRFQNTLYIATLRSVFYIENNRVVEVKGFPSGQYWDLLEYQTPDNKTILLAGTSSGIYEIKNKKAILIRGGHSAGKIEVSKLNPNRIFSTDSPFFISLLYQNGTWKDEGVWADIKDNVYQITEDTNGNIWLGTPLAGVIKVVPDTNNITKPQKVKYYATNEGLPSLRVVLPHFIKNSVVFGTENGLYAYNAQTDKMEPYCNIDAELCNESMDILKMNETAQGNIWVLPANNKYDDVGYFKPNSKGRYDLIYKPFARLPQMEFGCFYQDSAGVVWIGGTEGLFRYDPKQDLKNYDADFYTLIRKVSIGTDSVVYYGDGVVDTTMEGTETIKAFDYKYNSVKFEFAAPFFDDETKTQYSYQLVGFDENWSAWSYATEKEYTYLREKIYTFRVKAKNLYDKESFVAAYKIRILPPWYRTWWAYFLYALIGVGLIWFIVLINSRRLIKDKERLERIVQLRTAEIVQQKEEIQSIAENLKEANTAINQKNAALEQQKEEIMAIADNLQEANTAITQKNQELEQQKQEIQQQAEKLELYAKELEKLSIVASETDNAVMIMDAQGYFLWFNEGFTRLYGYTGEEYINMYPNVFVASTNPDIHQIIQSCIETRQSVIYETSGTTKNGDETWVQTTITPILNDNNEIEKLVAIDADIRKLKEAERQIRIKSEQITGSIRYARRIQQAILPIPEVMNRYFETFVFYSPKDIVSGDFYWFLNVELPHTQYCFFAVVDCTGHGVPGAFMSMIGNRLLNEIVNEQKIYEPRLILDNLNTMVVKALQQHQSENNDGMDMSLIRIEKQADKIIVVCAGAKNNIYHYNKQQEQLTEISVTRRSIGGYRIRTTDMPFISEELEATLGDVFYLYTDGIIDQNDQFRKRFGIKTFKQFILDNHNLPMNEQHNKLETIMKQWQQNTDQRDDITVLGLRII